METRNHRLVSPSDNCKGGEKFIVVATLFAPDRGRAHRASLSSCVSSISNEGSGRIGVMFGVEAACRTAVMMTLFISATPSSSRSASPMSSSASRSSIWPSTDVLTRSGRIEMSRTARNLPQLFRCSFSNRKKFQTKRLKEKLRGSVRARVWRTQSPGAALWSQLCFVFFSLLPCTITCFQKPCFSGLFDPGKAQSEDSVMTYALPGPVDTQWTSARYSVMTYANPAWSLWPTVNIW